MIPARSHIQRPSSRPPAVSRAFTIIELLVVTAIIILLLSILIVAVNAGSRTAQKTRTAALMDSMKKGLIRFKEDVGYYPPVLGVPYTTAGPGGNPTPAELRRLFPNSVPNPNATYTGGASYVAHVQEYYSTCTLADYLVGYGSHQEDGYGITTQPFPNDWASETPPAGIRNPGADGVWGATNVGTANADYGKLDMRMKWQTGNNPNLSNSYSRGLVNSPYPVDQGKVLGPYLELKDDRLLAAVYYGAGGLETYFPGDQLPAGQTWDSMPKAVVDYWGMPIRYYRRPYPPGALAQSYRSVGGQRVPTLSDVYALRPQTIKPGSESVNSFADADGNAVSSRELDAAEFALLSSGPDKKANQGATLHADNADNIVEVGP